MHYMHAELSGGEGGNTIVGHGQGTNKTGGDLTDEPFTTMDA